QPSASAATAPPCSGFGKTRIQLDRAVLHGRHYSDRLLSLFHLRFPPLPGEAEGALPTEPGTYLRRVEDVRRGQQRGVSGGDQRRDLGSAPEPVGSPLHVRHGNFYLSGQQGQKTARGQTVRSEKNQLRLLHGSDHQRRR